jgi:hypothetical protein
MREPIPDHIIERAVEIWCRALRQPKHDNGDNSATGAMVNVLHTSNMHHDLSKVDDLDAAIERFRTILIEKLKFLRENDRKPSGKTDKYGPVSYYFRHGLGCDYNPDITLAEAAAEAGVPESAFSWKSDVYMYPDYVRAAFGYAAKDTNHYPLGDGGWLICELSGQAMPLIIEAVKAGRLPELTVEKVGA